MHLVFFRLYVGGSHEGGNEGGNTGTKEEAKKGRKEETAPRLWLIAATIAISNY